MLPIVPDAPIGPVGAVRKENDAVITHAAYQVEPYDYYVKDYFLAKSLIYVLRYIHDDILFSIAVDEAALKCKIPRADIIEQVNKIKSLN